MPTRRFLASFLLVGCLSLDLRPKEQATEPIVAASEDGSQYVRVDGGVLTTRDGLLREWKRAAEKACDGDYMVLSDAAFERKKAGVVVSRSHEGYVRCIV